MPRRGKVLRWGEAREGASNGGVPSTALQATIPEGNGSQQMLRVTQDVVQVRSWVEARDGWPCRRLDGRVALNFPGEICRGLEVGWGEFEPNFCAGRLVFVHDDVAGSRAWFIGSPGEAREFVSRVTGQDAPALERRAVA